MTAAKQKGTAAEREVVKYLRGWWPAAERRALAGNKDKGDVAGIAGLVVEVKAAARPMLAAWYRETEAERQNAGATACMLVVKRAHKPVPRWDAYLPEESLVGSGLLVTLREDIGWFRMDLALAVPMLRSLGY